MISDLTGITFIMTLLHGMFGLKHGIRLRARSTLGFPVVETSDIHSSSTYWLTAEERMGGKFRGNCRTCQAGEAIKLQGLRQNKVVYVVVQPEPHKAKGHFQWRIPSSHTSHGDAKQPLENNALLLRVIWKPEGIVVIIQLSDVQPLVETC